MEPILTITGLKTHFPERKSLFSHGGSVVKAVDGIDLQIARGEILGTRVLAHAETPGLGDKIEINKADWITHFNGHSLSNTEAHQWAVKKDGGLFDQFSGATITPRAVVTAVHQALLDIEAATANGSMTTLPTKENTQ